MTNSLTCARLLVILLAVVVVWSIVSNVIGLRQEAKLKAKAEQVKLELEALEHNNKLFNNGITNGN